MNKRQKKKWIKRNLVRVKKLCPGERDIVLFMPDFTSDYIDMSTAVEFYNYCVDTGIFNHCGNAFIPYNIKKMDVDAAQTYLDNLQKVIDDRKMKAKK